jgi:hypothetical protein
MIRRIATSLAVRKVRRFPSRVQQQCMLYRKHAAIGAVGFLLMMNMSASHNTNVNVKMASIYHQRILDVLIMKAVIVKVATQAMITTKKLSIVERTFASVTAGIRRKRGQRRVRSLGHRSVRRVTGAIGMVWILTQITTSVSKTSVSATEEPRLRRKTVAMTILMRAVSVMKRIIVGRVILIHIILLREWI